MKVELGDLAKDEITGFEGVVYAKTEWLTNCTRYTLQPRKLDKEGKPIEAQSFDEPHVKLLKKGVVKTTSDLMAQRDPGGPMPNVTRARTPGR